MTARLIVRPLSRYILRQHLAPFGVALGALTLLMLGQQIAKQLPGLLGKGLPSSEIVEVFVLSVPFVVAVTLPMAVLIAVLRVFRRLAVDGARSGVRPASRRSRSCGTTKSCRGRTTGCARCRSRSSAQRHLSGPATRTRATAR